MDEEREKRAIERIDVAFARAEAALRQIRVNSASNADNHDSELALKHQKLRADTGQALAQLDALIGELSQ